MFGVVSGGNCGYIVIDTVSGGGSSNCCRWGRAGSAQVAEAVEGAIVALQPPIRFFAGTAQSTRQHVCGEKWNLLSTGFL